MQSDAFVDELINPLYYAVINTCLRNGRLSAQNLSSETEDSQFLRASVYFRFSSTCLAFFT